MWKWVVGISIILGIVSGLISVRDELYDYFYPQKQPTTFSEVDGAYIALQARDVAATQYGWKTAAYRKDVEAARLLRLVDIMLESETACEILTNNPNDFDIWKFVENHGFTRLKDIQCRSRGETVNALTIWLDRNSCRQFYSDDGWKQCRLSDNYWNAINYMVQTGQTSKKWEQKIEDWRKKTEAVSAFFAQFSSPEEGILSICINTIDQRVFTVAETISIKVAAKSINGQSIIPSLGRGNWDTCEKSRKYDISTFRNRKTKAANGENRYEWANDYCLNFSPKEIKETCSGSLEEDARKIAELQNYVAYLEEISLALDGKKIEE